MWIYYNIPVVMFWVFLFLFFFLVFFGCEVCEILTPQLGIEPAPLALEDEILTPGKMKY